MSLPPSLVTRWPELSPLLDEVLALPEDARGAWLDALALRDLELSESIRGLLPAARAGEKPPLFNLPSFVWPASPRDEATQLAGDTVGPYRLLSPLGQGGMGTVWLADRSDGHLKRNVALKLPRFAWDPSVAQRLGRERDILATLTHPNIARLYDAGVDQRGQPYLAMEVVQGAAIDRHCREHRLGVDDRIRLLLQVAGAVAYAHARLVIHRDLKPANILVTDEGQTKLLDFGIAKLLDGERVEESALTRVGGRMLTLDYASPEQIRGEPLSTSSDVYSLGVVAYELLSGNRPYRLKRGSAAELEEAITTVDPPPASAAAATPGLKKELRGDLDAILGAALRKTPAERYPSVEAFTRDLERHLADLPVEARPESIRDRLGKFVRRNRLVVSAAAAVGLAVVGGTGVALWQASVARDHARIAGLQAEVARKESVRAQAVQGFLLDIFRANSDQQPDPVKARNATARELLDIGAARLDSALRDSPEARAEVMVTLGQMYYQLSLNEQGAAIEGRRVELLKQLHGPRDRRVAEALVSLAASLQATARRQEIVPALEEARAILDGLGDRDSLLRGELLTTLAQRHQNLSLEKMQAYADEAVRVLRPYQRADTDRLSTSLQLAARARVQLGRPAEAEPIFREALAELRKTSPVPQVALVQGRLALGECLLAQQKLTLALQEYRETAGDAIAQLGASDPSAIVAVSRLAGLLHATGARAEARALHEDALRRVLEVKGADDTLFTPIVRTDFGRSLLAEGDLERALALISAVNASNRRHYAGSTVLGNGLRLEAAVLTAMGRHDEARKLFAEGFTTWQRGAGAGLHPSRHNRFHLDEARLDLAVGDADAAIARLAAVALPEDAERMPIVPDGIERDALLAQAYLRRGDVDRARALATRAADRLDARGALYPDLSAQVDAALRSARASASRFPSGSAASPRP